MLHAIWTRERTPRAQTLLCGLIGGGATLENFLTLHLCCARCWQTHPTRALLRGSLACSMPLLERIRRVPSGTTLSWQCSLSTTNAMYESLGLCHCFLFSGLVEYYFPREGSKYTHTHNTHTQHTHTHTHRHRRLWGWIDYLSIFRVKNEVGPICGKDCIDYFIDF